MSRQNAAAGRQPVASGANRPQRTLPWMSGREPVDIAYRLNDETFEARYITEPGQADIPQFVPTGQDGRGLHVKYKSGPNLWPRELEDIVHYRKQDFDAVPDSDRQASFWDAEGLKTILKSKRSRFLLVHTKPEAAPRVIDGYLQFELYRRNGVAVLEVHNLFLAESVRYLGLAQHLLQLIELVASRVPVLRLITHFMEKSHAAVRLFTRAGWYIDPPLPGRPRSNIITASKQIAERNERTTNVQQDRELGVPGGPSRHEDRIIAHVSVRVGIGRQRTEQKEKDRAMASSEVIERALASIRAQLEAQADKVLKQGKSLTWSETGLEYP